MWPLSPLKFDPTRPADATLWLSEPGQRIDEQSFLASLNPAERTRHSDLTLRKRYEEYGTARALQRHAVGLATGIAPDRLSFTIGEHGKPAHSQCDFNITHTQGLVACVVSHIGPIGLDAEPLTRGEEVISVMRRVFTTTERTALMRLPLAQMQQAAVELWTLKEAVMKESGKGMTIEPASFNLTVRNGRIQITGQSKHLELFHLETGHSLALCCKETAPLNIKIEKFPTPYPFNS